MASTAPVGAITRGTTNPNRLRRCDRWLVGPHAARLRSPLAPPVAVDLGFGASSITTVELFDRLRAVRGDVEVVGIEIDPARVSAASMVRRPGLSFRLGGFEIPLADGMRPTIVRAFNVLRQYDEAQVRGHWDLVCSRLAPGGLFVDGTCDEIGRRAAWVALEPGGPISLTLSWHLRGLQAPSEIAERLPKALIHHNVPGRPIHALLGDLDEHWRRAAAYGAYGVRQRFLATAEALARDWPLQNPGRWRLGEVTLAWSAVAP